MRIIRRAREGLVKARVRDAVVRTLVPEKIVESPKLNADGVVPLGQPLPVWEWPIQKERRSDHELEEEEWDLPGLRDPDHSWWATGDLEISSTTGTREGASLFGIEFDKSDILRMRPTESSASPELGQRKGRKRSGRPAGSGSLAQLDAPLLIEMAELIRTQKVLSPSAAAMAVADRAAGGGTMDNKATRLRKAFMARENNGAK